jgi:hypothetical protein
LSTYKPVDSSIDGRDSSSILQEEKTRNLLIGLIFNKILIGENKKEFLERTKFQSMLFSLIYEILFEK